MDYTSNRFTLRFIFKISDSFFGLSTSLNLGFNYEFEFYLDFPDLSRSRKSRTVGASHIYIGIYLLHVKTRKITFNLFDWHNTNHNSSFSLFSFCSPMNFSIPSSQISCRALWILSTSETFSWTHLSVASVVAGFNKQAIGCIVKRQAAASPRSLIFVFRSK